MYDSGNPNVETTEPVQINIVRNLNDPVFNSTTYSESILDYQKIGTSVLQVFAADSDITVGFIIKLFLCQNFMYEELHLPNHCFSTLIYWYGI